MTYIINPRMAKCIVCSRKFLRKGSNQKMCSSVCVEKRTLNRNQGSARALEIRKCVVCGGNFSYRPYAVVCSQKCRNERKRLRKNGRRNNGSIGVKTCKTCNRKFVALGFGRQIYCSKRCRVKSPEAKLRERDRNRLERMTLKAVKQLGFINMGELK